MRHHRRGRHNAAMFDPATSTQCFTAAATPRRMMTQLCAFG